MRYVVTAACIDVLDGSCVESCPVDCLYRGARKMYIHPDECIGCGACVPACPTSAIFRVDQVPADQLVHDQDARRFFAEPLPGLAKPIGSPEGAAEFGPIGVDTPLVSEYKA
jgi:ferredoxin